MQKAITVHDLAFEPYLHRRQIAQRVRALGRSIRSDYFGKKPLFAGVLNGAFIFAADLVRACGDLPCETAFVRLASYDGLQSSGRVNSLLGFEAATIRGRHVIVVEDIVDTGRTLHYFLEEIKKMQPASIALAVLLRKPDAVQFPVPVDYLGFDIPDRFVIGYGLDYNGLGRNLADVWVVGSLQ